MERCPECETMTSLIGKYVDMELAAIRHGDVFTDEIRVITGDIFIHKRTGIEYVFYHDRLGTRIERAKS